MGREHLLGSSPTGFSSTTDEATTATNGFTAARVAGRQATFSHLLDNSQRGLTASAKLVGYRNVGGCRAGEQREEKYQPKRPHQG